MLVPVQLLLHGHGEGYGGYSRAAGECLVFHAPLIGPDRETVCHRLYEVHINALVAETFVIPDGPSLAHHVQVFQIIFHADVMRRSRIQYVVVSTAFDLVYVRSEERRVGTECCTGG